MDKTINHYGNFFKFHCENPFKLNADNIPNNRFLVNVYRFAAQRRNARDAPFTVASYSLIIGMP